MLNIVHVMLMAPIKAPISPQHSVARLTVFNMVMAVMLRMSSRLRPRPKLLLLTAGANRLSMVMMDMAAMPATSNTAAGAVKLVMAEEVMVAMKLVMVASK